MRAPLHFHPTLDLCAFAYTEDEGDDAIIGGTDPLQCRDVASQMEALQEGEVRTCAPTHTCDRRLLHFRSFTTTHHHPQHKPHSPLPSWASPSRAPSPPPPPQSHHQQQQRRRRPRHSTSNPSAT